MAGRTYVPMSSCLLHDSDAAMSCSGFAGVRQSDCPSPVMYQQHIDDKNYDGWAAYSLETQPIANFSRESDGITQSLAHSISARTRFMYRQETDLQNNEPLLLASCCAIKFFCAVKSYCMLRWNDKTLTSRTTSLLFLDPAALWSLLAWSDGMTLSFAPCTAEAREREWAVVPNIRSVSHQARHYWSFEQTFEPSTEKLHALRDHERRIRWGKLLPSPTMLQPQNRAANLNHSTLKLEILNIKIWGFQIKIHQIWRLDFRDLESEILNPEVWDRESRIWELNIWNWKIWNFNIWNMGSWQLKF